MGTGSNRLKNQEPRIKIKEIRMRKKVKGKSIKLLTCLLLLCLIGFLGKPMEQSALRCEQVRTAIR
ncbi:hypothetical protein D0T49_12835 [Paludibacter sp. 221]|nr:hypothetical protein [Paludibacter sp. 221]